MMPELFLSPFPNPKRPLMQSKSVGISIMMILLCLSLFAAPKSPVVFNKEYANYAWGYVHYGWLIDSAGNIRSYSFNQGDSMEVRLPYPSQTYLDKMFSLSTPTGKKIAADTMSAKTALLASAVQGLVTYAVMCADAGIMSYEGILYDSAHSRYQRIVCFEAGDQTACNSSLSAKLIAKWLVSLDSIPPNFCLPPDSCLNTTGIVNKACFPKTNAARLNAQSIYYVNGKKIAAAGKKPVLKTKAGLIQH